MLKTYNLIVVLFIVVLYSCTSVPVKMLPDRIERVTFMEQFSEKKDFSFTHIEGIYIPFMSGDYYSFVKLEANLEDVKNYIEKIAIYEGTGFVSDEKFKPSDSTKIFNSIKKLTDDYPDLKDSISFFSAIKNMDNIQYFSCNRYPNAHVIGYHEPTKVIYHFMERYPKPWDDKNLEQN